MTIPAWLRQPETRFQVATRLLLAVAMAWGLFRTVRSVTMLFGVSHDLGIYQSLWFLLMHRDFADIALGQALYLPHTWLVLTPLFLLGWPATKVLMLLLNIASVFYIWWRLSRLAGLDGIRRWLLLAFLWGWLPTGLVIGLGNLALVCVAAVLAAYPFSSVANSVWLTLSAMKHSLVFPIYFRLLFKRPKVLILPFAVITLCGLASLFWARLGLADILPLAKGLNATVESWTRTDITSLRRLFRPALGDTIALSAVVWACWFGLYALVARRVRDPLAQLAALLLLSLLPIYHQQYDLVAAAPTLALFLKRGSLVWPVTMTLLLAVNLVSAPTYLLPSGLLRNAADALLSVYTPLFILALLGRIIWLETRSPSNLLPSLSPQTVPD
jgi:hypothetical protein